MRRGGNRRTEEEKKDEDGWLREVEREAVLTRLNQRTHAASRETRDSERSHS